MHGSGEEVLCGSAVRARGGEAPHSKWATGSNLVYVSYAADPERNLVIALAAIDNLGKGAAGQAVQNANLMMGLAETAGLEGTPLWP